MREIFLKRQKHDNTSRYFIVLPTLILILCGAAFGQATNPTPQPTPAGTTNPRTTPPTNPTTSATPPTINPSVPTVPQTAAPTSRDQAVQMTLRQVSTYNQTQLNERLAAEDIRQSKAALYPRITANPTLIFTSPSLTNTNPNVAAPLPGGTNLNSVSRLPSYLGANAITEYQGLVTALGEIDTSGGLRATIRRNQALLDAARSGTEAARRNLIVGLDEAYLNLALATTKTAAARENLRVAQDFENLTKLLAQGGEVPPIDGVRTEVQSAARRDELLQAELAEQQAADALRVFIGYDFSQPISVGDLLTSVPDLSELENLTSGAGSEIRPEIAQINAEIRAAKEGVKIARAERRPQLTYIMD
ncbi:MAG: TolC family protein, partial [Pyrinomonadaceae bacterium]